MRICFIHPPWGDVYSQFKDAARLGNSYPPLGLCYLSAMIKQERPDDIVRIIDMEVEGVSLPELLIEIATFRPDLVGIVATSPIFNMAETIAKELKIQFKCPVVLGGPHPTVLPKETLEKNPQIDYVIAGEGEETIVALLNLIENNHSSDIPGLWRRDEVGKIVISSSRELNQDLDKLPIPRRELLPINNYLWSIPGKKGFVKFTTIMTYRGCPFQCIFCSARAVFGGKVRKRSVDLILDEMEQVIRDFDIRHFSFIDDTLTLNRKHISAISQGIIDRKLNITWEGFTRANLVDQEILDLMAKAGLVRISFGIETGDAEMLKRIKKGVTLGDIPKAFAMAKKAGLETKGSAIIGFPHETRETLTKTIDFLYSLKNCDQVYLNICTPYPGSELWDMALRGEGGMELLTKDFSQYKRYGNPVVRINDIEPEDLINFQRKGMRKFYFTPRRIWYNLTRAGFAAGIKNAIAFARGAIFPAKMYKGIRKEDL